MDGLLSISDFAARCGLSPKMLRSYAATGLLVPAATDAASGYRYYSTDQLEPARIIALLRKADIPLVSIGEFLAEPAPQQLDEWATEALRSSMHRREALDEVRTIITRAISNPPYHQSVTSRERSDWMSSTLVAGSATHIGGRDTNEDATLVGERLFAVADGMGGLGYGADASSLALDAVDVGFAADPTIAGLLKAVRSANQAVWMQGQARETPMGTTLTALALTADAAVAMVHVGDSRLYRFRSGRLSPLTEDHTVVAELLIAGDLTPEEAMDHPWRHVLTRALGVAPEMQADYAGVSLQSGDRLVLCSDGLAKSLSADGLEQHVAAHVDAQVCADQLVAAAVKTAPEDNVTVLVVDVL